jgi:hypothetical protein
MSVQSKPYYWLTCDCCGEKSTEGDDYAAWSEEADALMRAEACGWMRIDGQDYCEDCLVMGEDHWERHPETHGSGAER